MAKKKGGKGGYMAATRTTAEWDRDKSMDIKGGSVNDGATRSEVRKNQSATGHR